MIPKISTIMIRGYALFFFMALLTHSTEAAAVTFAGKVLDPQGAGVPGATITLTPGNVSVKSTSGGVFRFDGLQPGEYRVAITSPQFEPIDLQTVRLPAGGTGEGQFQFSTVAANHMQVDVIGTEPEVALQEIPGSAFLVQREELERSSPADANEVLRRVPGLHVREDSGPVGMRMNIGVRGLNPDRSRSLLVLEDGLPVALAPYGEPEMYYSPPIDRMSRIEVLKGSGSIAHGPQTVGGVLNFITPDPPLKPHGEAEILGGQYGMFLGRAAYGGTHKSIGWYLSGLRKQGEGWRDFYYGISDITGKVTLSASDRHRFGIKGSFYDEGSNSTYLGLTTPLYQKDANFNPVPGDRLNVQRYSGSLLHQYIANPRAILSTSVFGYNTARDWRRQDFDRAPRSGTVYRDVFGDTSIPGGAFYMRDSATNNNREFDVVGAETRLATELRIFGVRSKLDTGFRYVWEEHRDRQIQGAGYQASEGVIRNDEVRNGNAVSGFAQLRMALTGNLTVTPGLRLERYRYARNIFRRVIGGVPTDADVTGGDALFQPIPGLGLNYQLTSGITLFAGGHRGFAPPRVKDAILPTGTPLQLDAELSWNWEAGSRFRIGRGFRAEATVFRTDFSNQIIPASVSGGATSTLMNAGRTMHEGAEFNFGIDWQQLTGRRLDLITDFRYTYLGIAEFRNGIYNRNRLPYAPVHNYSMTAGYTHRRGLSLFLDGTRVGSQFADNRETVPTTADGTIGLIPSYWVWNFCAGQEFRWESFSIKPFVSVKNFSDSRYISSRAPQGIQPGMFRQAQVGIKFQF